MRAKTATRPAAAITERVVEAERALQELESFRRHHDERGERSSAGSLAISTMTVKHQHRFGCRFITNRAARASACERCAYCSHIFILLVIIMPDPIRSRSRGLATRLSGCAAAADLFEDLGGRFIIAVLVVPIPPLIRRGLSIAFRRVLPLLLAPEGSDVQVVPSTPHLLVTAAV